MYMVKNYAYNPESCVFVSANAGSGKTSLLTKRVLSLLLHGVEPTKILCLTFTNAAAAEMSNRILSTLGKWVMASKEELTKQLEELTGEAASDKLINHARSLFATVLESPSGVNIQTIHGFCQSLLRRFPIEAGVSPHFKLIDERSQKELLTEARLRLFNMAQKSDVTIQKSIESLARQVSEHSFNGLMRDIIKNKRKFSSLLKSKEYGDLHLIKNIIAKYFAVGSDFSLKSLTKQYFNYDKEKIKALREICGLLYKSDKATDINTGKALTNWLENEDDREKNYNSYIDAFITKDGDKRKKIFTKNTLKNEYLEKILIDEQEVVFNFYDKLNALSVAEHSVDIVNISAALLAQYEAIKNQHAWLDYDDLIITSCNLLSRSGMSEWVLFKLDGGIDHILVDEAQDTSPEQWKIVDTITREFFAGYGAKEITRSLFVVGDEKQSIFSFQGADVKELSKMQEYFSGSIKSSGRNFHLLSLTNSYRSLPSILKVVDSVFAKDSARGGVTFLGDSFSHIPMRSNSTGVVELFPLIQPSSNYDINYTADDINKDSLENDEEENLPSQKILIRHIADSIRKWIDGQEAQAGDIMILLRSRTTFADRMVRALKRRGVAVAGSDRMRLNDNIAVQDLIALGQVLLLPDDDLTMASCLKSPIFNISEEDLFTLAYGRDKKTIWQRFLEFPHDKFPKIAQIYELLKDLRAKADFMPCFELYSYLLDVKEVRNNFLARMGEECLDPIDEFMQQCLVYERSHAQSLQGFIWWILHSDSEIKRDMEQAKNAVRVMTVHGSKGLQSKIVILPDTVLNKVPNDDLLFFNKGGYEIPVRSVSSKKRDTVFDKILKQRENEILSEYRRLLYVALTRAEDRLYIYGASGNKKIKENSWYHHIKTGMEEIAEPFTTEFGEGLRVGKISSNPVNNNKITALPDNTNLDYDLSFLQKQPPLEPSPSVPLTPSDSTGEAPAVSSPLSSKNIYSRGKFIHLLLQYLPLQEQENRKKTAEIISRKFSSELKEDVIKEAISDVDAVLNNKEFSFLFGKDSSAEIPITGNVDISGKTISVSGQVDRLYIGENEAWIVDFKSNRMPPDSHNEIPEPYIRQLYIYKLLLKKIMPQKQIKCALLWTVNTKLDILPDALLDEYGASFYI